MLNQNLIIHTHHVSGVKILTVLKLDMKMKKFPPYKIVEELPVMLFSIVVPGPSFLSSDWLSCQITVLDVKC